MVRVSDLQSSGRGFNSDPGRAAIKYRNNSRQVVHSHVPLSPSSIIWYRPSGSGAIRLGR